MNLITWKYTKECINEDYARLGKRESFFKMALMAIAHPSFSVTYWFRIGSYLASRKNVCAKLLLIPVKIIYHINQRLTGIQLPLLTDIRGGLNFKHFNCIVFAMSSHVGRNCTFHQGVTVGRVFAGKKAGCPTIGDNVIVFAGAKIVGNICIGDNVIVAANAVVVDDVPNNAIVAGIPAKVISTDSSRSISEEWRSAFGWN